MKKYGVEFHFFSPSRICLGLEFLQGIIHEESGDSYYKELVIGFFFFHIEITVRQS